jgi:hypothetical protein
MAALRRAGQLPISSASSAGRCSTTPCVASRLLPQENRLFGYASQSVAKAAFRLAQQLNSWFDSQSKLASQDQFSDFADRR